MAIGVTFINVALVIGLLPLLTRAVSWLLERTQAPHTGAADRAAARPDAHRVIGYPGAGGARPQRNMKIQRNDAGGAHHARGVGGGMTPARSHPAYWAFLVHRLSGLALALFLSEELASLFEDAMVAY